MSSPTTNEAAVREAIRAIIAPMPIDKIIGQPTNLTVNLFKQQVTKIVADMKTTSWGRRHGHLALVLTDAEDQSIMGDPTVIVDHLITPTIVPEGLTNTTTLTYWAAITGMHKIACQEFWKQEAIDAIIVKKIVREAVDLTHI